jgi:hypothetical protein
MNRTERDDDENLLKSSFGLEAWPGWLLLLLGSPPLLPRALENELVFMAKLLLLLLLLPLLLPDFFGVFVSAPSP